METVCTGGAVMCGRAMAERDLRQVGDYGMHIGMLYQMVDDYLDGDSGVTLTMHAITRLADKSKNYLQVLPHSQYRTKLLDLVDHVARMAMN